jgi:hypothetical protein
MVQLATGFANLLRAEVVLRPARSTTWSTTCQSRGGSSRNAGSRDSASLARRGTQGNGFDHFAKVDVEGSNPFSRSAPGC